MGPCEASSHRFVLCWCFGQNLFKIPHRKVVVKQWEVSGLPQHRPERLSVIFGIFTCRKAFGDHYLARRVRGFLATFPPALLAERWATFQELDRALLRCFVPWNRWDWPRTGSWSQRERAACAWLGGWGSWGISLPICNHHWLLPLGSKSLPLAVPQAARALL